MTLPSIPALSVRQPWAWLICDCSQYPAPKRYENRTQYFNYRGPLFIHAPKTFDAGAYDQLTFDTDLTLPSKSSFQRGGIIGIAEVVACVTHSDSFWYCGPFALVLHDAVSLPFIPCLGQQGLFQPQI